MRRLIYIYIFIGLLSVTQPVSATGNLTVTTNSPSQSSNIRQGLIMQVLSSSAMNFPYNSLAILIDETLIEPRGRMKGRNITLSANIPRDGEFLKLLVHELGHYIDIYYLARLGNSDISDDFYRISWDSPTVRKSSEKQGAFVSGYALTNQYEDFAEAFTMYVFHNRTFEDRAVRNESLRQKYLFIQSSVFPGGAFTDSDFSLGRVPGYLWDTTKIQISLQKYLFSLR